VNGVIDNVKNSSLATVFSSIFSFEELESVETKELILSHIVPQGVNLYVAQGGSGKTYLAYHILIQFLKRGGGCVYIDFDNPVDLPKARGLLKVVRGFKDNFVYFNFLSYQKWAEDRKDKSYKKFLEWVFSRLPENNEYFVVLDSLQNFIPNVSDDSLTFAFFKLLREWSQKKNITFIVLHHISKVARWTKGSTNIVNMSDVAYQIKAEREGGLIVSYSLILEKARYLCPEELTISLKDNYEIEISEHAIADENVKIILRVVVSILRKEGELNQSQLSKRMKEKGFNEKKVIPVLKEYVDKGLFRARKGDKNATFYTVNEDSEYVSLLFNRELSEAKKTLLQFVEELMNDEITEFPEEIFVNQFRFLSPIEVKKSIYRLTDEEAEAIYHQLLKLFPDSPFPDSPDSFEFSEDGEVEYDF
jgi:KaiC/GvpD/RAD55 family RecA-like ATPase